MTLSVTLLTEREHFVRQWRQALTKHDIESKVVAPSDLANAVAEATAEASVRALLITGAGDKVSAFTSDGSVLVGA